MPPSKRVEIAPESHSSIISLSVNHLCVGIFPLVGKVHLYGVLWVDVCSPDWLFRDFEFFTIVLIMKIYVGIQFKFYANSQCSLLLTLLRICVSFA